MHCEFWNFHNRFRKYSTPSHFGVFSCPICLIICSKSVKSNVAADGNLLFYAVTVLFSYRVNFDNVKTFASQYLFEAVYIVTCGPF